MTLPGSRPGSGSRPRPRPFRWAHSTSVLARRAYASPQTGAILCQILGFKDSVQLHFAGEGRPFRVARHYVHDTAGFQLIRQDPQPSLVEGLFLPQSNVVSFIWSELNRHRFEMQQDYLIDKFELAPSVFPKNIQQR